MNIGEGTRTSTVILHCEGNGNKINLREDRQEGVLYTKGSGRKKN